MFTTLKLDTTPIVSAARELAQENGTPVGAIGRVSVEVLANYFVKTPKTARELGSFLGIEVPSKGRLPKDTAKVLALAIR